MKLIIALICATLTASNALADGEKKVLPPRIVIEKVEETPVEQPVEKQKTEEVPVAEPTQEKEPEDHPTPSEINNYGEDENYGGEDEEEDIASLREKMGRQNLMTACRNSPKKSIQLNCAPTAEAADEAAADEAALEEAPAGFESENEQEFNNQSAELQNPADEDNQEIQLLMSFSCKDLKKNNFSKEKACKVAEGQQ